MTLLCDLLEGVCPSAGALMREGAARAARAAARRGLARGRDGVSTAALVGVCAGCGVTLEDALRAYGMLRGVPPPPPAARVAVALRTLAVAAPAAVTPPPAPPTDRPPPVFARIHVVLVPRGGLGSAHARALLSVVLAHAGTGVVHPARARRPYDRRLVVVCGSAMAAVRELRLSPGDTIVVRAPEWVPRSVAAGRPLTHSCLARDDDQAMAARQACAYEAERVQQHHSLAFDPPEDVRMGEQCGQRAEIYEGPISPCDEDARSPRKRPRGGSADPSAELGGTSDSLPSKRIRPDCVPDGDSPQVASGITAAGRRVNRATFACENGVSDDELASLRPVNAVVVRALSALAARAELSMRAGRAADAFRARGLRAAAAAIRRLPTDTTCVEDVRAIVADPRVPSVGARVGARMEEIIRTGRLREAEEACSSPMFRALDELIGVWGIGPVRAAELLADGVSSVGELRLRVAANPALLDRQQRIGLRCYEDLLERIPREEVAMIEEYIRQCVARCASGKSIRVTVAGSYLRGKDSCGDVDIMLTGDTATVSKALSDIIQVMARDGVLTDSLLCSPRKFFGVIRLRSNMHHRRLDLFAVPPNEYAFALLTYTGSCKFNRSMRCLAGKLGYRLSHKGIRRVRRTPKGAVAIGPPIPCASENEVFDLLGLTFKVPDEREV